MRNLFLDRWNLWPRLTFYRTWRDEYGHPKLDGTNNDCERSIGWWVKERYRSMRGYKREQSALNVSRLIAFAGNHLSHGLNLIRQPHARPRVVYCRLPIFYQIWNSHS
jgi:hypothetical protein